MGVVPSAKRVGLAAEKGGGGMGVVPSATDGVVESRLICRSGVASIQARSRSATVERERNPILLFMEDLLERENRPERCPH